MRAVRLTLLSVVLVFMGAVTAAAQQTGTVTGQVSDASTGQPLTGVQMQVAGTNIGGLTDQNGRYLITRVPTGEQTIRAVLIGYAQATETVSITAGGTATADFQLRTSAVPLEAVIVSAATGREQRSRELGSKVSSIEVQDLNPAPVTTFADAIGGRSSGVIMQDVNGTTGTSQRIRIRGANSLSLSNEPLIYVDGVQISTSTDGFGVGGQDPSRLNDLNPNDIANIEIVKGPAASALYGTAAANGVILITTKRGRPGDSNWTVFAETGVMDDITDWPANYLAYSLDDGGDPNAPVIVDGSFNGANYGTCSNRAAAAGLCEQVGMIQFNPLEDSRTTPFSTGVRQRYGASVRGGTEQVRYFVSGQYEDETGVIDYNVSEKVNFRANLDAELAETVDLSVSFGYTDSNLGLNSNDNSIFSPIINGLAGMPWFIPEEPGSSVPSADNFGWGFSKDDLAYLVTYQDVDRFMTSANLRWRPMPWLTVNATGGLDMTDIHDYETLQPGSPMAWLALSYRNGFRDSQRGNDYLYTGQASAVGTFDLTDGLLSTTTVGMSYSRDLREDTECYGSSLIPGTASCGTTASEFFIDENFAEVKTVGAYVQQELAWRDRVFVAAGLRADDNSAFGQDFDLAYYPSASLSWVVAEEEWFPELDFLSTLRLRSSYGVSGLQPGFRDAITLYSPATVASPAGDIPGVQLDVTGNVELKPERSAEYEFGFDSGLFDDRLALEFTYFNKKSEDALVSRRLSGSLGLTASRYENLGSIRNSGTEFLANLMVFDTDNFGLNLGFSNTTLDNEIETLGENVEPITFNRGLQRHEEGYSAGSFFQRELVWDDTDGDGKIDYWDTDGNGVVDPDETEITLGEEKYIGPALPTWQRSIFADVRVFDFLTISTLFEGRGGHYTGNDSEAFRCGLSSTYRCAAVADPDASLEDQARYVADRYLGSAYGFVEKGDFYKWRELSVTFSVPEAWSQRFSRAEGLRLTLAGRNLATFTDYSGLDPETVEGGGNANFSQSEFNTQPPVRYLMLRLDYTF